MNLFSKQISTIFFSLFFFLLSGEAWGTAQSVDISDCKLSTTEGVCANTCAAGDTHTFKVNGVTIAASPSTVVTEESTPTAAQIKISGCKEACLNACLTYRNGPEFAVASTSVNTFSKTICNAFRIATGSAGKTFAAFAIIATGIGFFSGKVSWGLMIGVAAGIATMFGAPSIVAAISGTTVNTQCSLAAG